jgi:transmembrane sensor
MDPKKPHDGRIAAPASDWLLRLDGASAAEQVAFLEWLMESASHVDEFLLATAFHEELSGIDLRSQHRIRTGVADGWANVVPLQPAAPRLSSPAPRWRRPTAWASAACLALAAIAVAHLYVPRVSDYSTATGEHRIVTLADGSQLHLNTHSSVRTRFNAFNRDVALLEGEALFTVARDPKRPFRVSTDVVTVQAVGTQFNVYCQDNRRVTVSLVEGRVKVFSPGNAERGALLLEAGQEAEVPGSASPDTLVVRRIPANELARRLAWRNGDALFTGQTLAEAAAHFNRYNARQILIDDPQIASRRIGGRFRVGDVDGFVATLREAFGVQVFYSTSGSPTIRLAHAPPSNTLPHSRTALPSLSAPASFHAATR